MADTTAVVLGNYDLMEVVCGDMNQLLLHLLAVTKVDGRLFLNWLDLIYSNFFFNTQHVIENI